MVIYILNFSLEKLINRRHIIPITEIKLIHLVKEIIPNHEKFLENINELEMYKQWVQ